MTRLNTIVLTAIFSLLFCAGTLADEVAPVLEGVSADFELQNRDGDLVRDEDFRGRNVLLAFGFTHCAHICPMIASRMAAALRLAGHDAVGVFVSVDTERDTPSITDDYAGNFGERMIGLSGAYSQVSAAAKNFNVTYVVTKSEDNYTVQHTPSIFLIGPDGAVIDVYALTAAAEDIAAAMR